MRWIGKTGRKLLALFVDDFAFAGAILFWLLLNGALLGRLSLSGGWRGGILFAGLAVILGGGALKRAFQ